MRPKHLRGRKGREFNEAAAALIQRAADATTVEEIEAATAELQKLIDGAPR
jgi:hypothetical protein